jgi:glycosyltransferase involved in cell wall biosynthesis
MKIGIVQQVDVTDVRLLSGTPHSVLKALQKHVGDVVNLGPDNTLLTKGILNAGRVLNRVSYSLLKRRISPDHHWMLARRLAHVFGARAAQSGCDVIFAPNASVEIARLAVDIPIIYYSDMLWANTVDYYEASSSLFDFSAREGDRIEASAISNASALIFPSQWAARTAIEHYKADAARVYCIPCGANFEDAEVPSREESTCHSLDREIVLLWVGVDWKRKGGSIAFDCLKELLDRGKDARLVVCGCVPPDSYRHPKVEIVPFLNKSDPVQRRRLSQLFLRANFFLFPTMAEAFGIVLCEASAHGLPALVRSTGGVGGAVTDGENGYLLPPDAEGKQYAERILSILEDSGAYNRLVKTSRMAYEERLNWDAWGRSVKPVFERVLKEMRS